MKTNIDLTVVKKIINKIIERKYLWTTIAMIIWMMFFTRYNWSNLYKTLKNINTLNKEKEYYCEKIHNDSIMLDELKTNDYNLEKFAREQYYMKANDEDVFVIRER